MSTRPCVLYRIFSGDDRLLYAGISTSPAARIKQHADQKPWWAEAMRIELEHFDTEQDAAQAEKVAIATENPVHNLAGGGRRMSDEERERRQQEREAAEDEQERIWNTTYSPADTACTNCGWKAVFLPRGKLIAECECGHCGCKTLERTAKSS